MPSTNGRYAVAYTEYVENYREVYRTNGNETVRFLQCAWRDRTNFMYDMLGFSESPGSGQLSRQIPEQHPDLLHLYAADAEMIQGIGRPDQDASTQLISFFDGPTPPDSLFVGDTGSGIARFAVTYRTFPFDILADDDIGTELDRYVERRTTYATEAFLIPGQTLKWSSDNKVIQEPTTKAFYTKELSYRWVDVPAVPTSSIETCINKVNSTTFDGYTAGKLLMIAPNLERTYNAVGQVVWEIIYKFLWRANGWNQLYRRSSGVFADVVNTVGGQPAIYDTADFNTLFVEP
jgi:hypothetical protein